MAEYSRLVYSTDSGRTDAPPVPTQARRPKHSPGPQPPRVPDDGVIRVFRDRGGRKGKTVTVVTGVPLQKLAEVASQLKRAAAAGGAIRDSTVEIQGDHRELVAARLSELGYRVKLAGG